MTLPLISRRQAGLLGASALVGCATTSVKTGQAYAADRPDITVAADGSGQFRSVHAALQSIPKNRRERTIVLIKDGQYAEQVRVDAPYVTVRGQSRAGVRIHHARPSNDKVDDLGQAVFNISANAHDLVLENLTIENTHGVIGPHAMAVLGRADRVVIQDCDLLSLGADTLSMWRGTPAKDEAKMSTAPGARPLAVHGGRYYHRRLRVTGSVDFVCPRGWCYMADSTILQVNPGATAAVWHDGVKIADKKFVLQRCQFDGPPNWYLARRHHDGQFFFIDCKFSATLRDQPPYRQRYPLDGRPPNAAEIQKNAELDRSNLFGDRNYFHNSHRVGGADYAWHGDNLSSAAQQPPLPIPESLAAWTFGGTWAPDSSAAPELLELTPHSDSISLRYAELVSVRGLPALLLSDGSRARFLGGSGSDTLHFERARTASDVRALQLAQDGGAVIASEASATPRRAGAQLLG